MVPDDAAALLGSAIVLLGATPAPSLEQPHPRPAVLDGSFKVLVIGN